MTSNEYFPPMVEADAPLQFNPANITVSKNVNITAPVVLLMPYTGVPQQKTARSIMIFSKIVHRKIQIGYIHVEMCKQAEEIKSGSFNVEMCRQAEEI